MDKLANSNQELTASYANEKRLLKEKIALGILKELPHLMVHFTFYR